MPCPSQETIQSKVEPGEVACPACGAVEPVQLWHVLEADLNPERAAQLADGGLLVHACARCGKAVPLDYPLFYVDRGRGVGVYYPAGQGDLEALKTAFVQGVLKVGGVDLGSLRRREMDLRVAPALHELVEKVAAWRSGLDDRMLELLKVQLVEELAAQNPDRRICDATFVGAPDDGQKLAFVLFAHPEGDDAAVVPAGAQIALPRAAYDRLARSGDVLAAVDRRYAPVVDAAWARSILAGLRGA